MKVELDFPLSDRWRVFSWISGYIAFVEEMWDTYRADYGCVWTRDDPTDIYSNGSNSCEQGKIYYLDASATGAETGLNWQDAWTELAQAQANLQAGDTVMIRSGNYGDFVEGNITRTDWVTYKAEDGHTPVFSKIEIYNSTQQDVYLRFDNVTVQHDEPNPLPPDDGTKHWIGNLVSIYRSNYVEVLNSTLKGYNKYLSGEYAVDVEYSDNVKIQHCDMSTTYRGILGYNTHNLTVSYNHIHDIAAGSGIRLGMLDTGPLDMTGTVIEGNHLHDRSHDENDLYFPHNSFHYGSGFAVRASNLVIRNNIIHDGWGQGILFYLDTGVPYSNIVLENNLFYDVGKNTIQNINGPLIVKNNTFIGAVDPRYDGTTDSEILNRYYDSTPLSIYFNSGFDGTGVEIYNNLVVGTWILPDIGLNYEEDYNLFWSQEGPGEGCHGLHNIKGANSFLALWKEEGILHGWPNLFEDIGFKGTTAEYDFETDGIQPFFVNPGFYTYDYIEHTSIPPEEWPHWQRDQGRNDLDYHLAADSQGINFGDPNNQPADSLGTVGPDGFIQDDPTARDVTHHSVGCYEYIPTGPQPPVGNAGADQTVVDSDGNGSEEVTLDGSGSFDPDGTIVSFIWSEDGLEIATGIKPTVTLSTGTHLITLTVTDNGGLTDTDTVTIKVLKEDKEFGKLPTGCYNNVIKPLKGEKAIIMGEIEKRGYVKISVYDTKGKKIRELADEERDAGPYKYYWEGKNDSGNVVGSGLYFVHIQAGDYKKTKKIVVIK